MALTVALDLLKATHKQRELYGVFIFERVDCVARVDCCWDDAHGCGVLWRVVELL